MPVIVKHSVDDENAPVLGRVDIYPHAYDFGVTVAKRHPPYVFGIRGVSCLVHRVRRVELHWYRIADHGRALVKMKRPVMIASTVCQQSFRLDGDISRTCQLPKPDALLCGRCQRKQATFPKRGNARIENISRQEAHVKLGCIVNGY